jgi:hypothetical protein
MNAPIGALQPLDRQTFREHPERIHRPSHAELVERGRTGGRKGAAVRVEIGHGRAVRQLLLAHRVTAFGPEDMAVIEAVCRAVAKSCYRRGYNAALSRERHQARRTERAA